MDNSDGLDKIAAAVNERNKKIWENEAYSACLKKGTEKLKSEIDRLNKERIEMENADKALLEQIDDLDKSIEIQKETLRISEQSVLMHQSYKENLKQQVQEMKNKYAETLEEYEKEYLECRAIYENETIYKDLQAREIELKKLEIQQMALKAKNRQLVKIKNQFDEIQRKIRNAAIVKFARFCLLYYEYEASEKKLAEMKKEEERLMREHVELKQKLAEKQKMCKEKDHVEDESPIVTLPKEGKEKASADVIKKFLSDEFQPFGLTSLDQTIKPVLSKDASKVRVFEVKVEKPLPSKSVRLENIDEAIRKSALKSSSWTATPVSSQETQSQEKQSQEKKSRDVSTDVSQDMVALNLDEKVVASKTFQLAGNKSMNIFQKPFALNKHNPQEENQPLFGILNKSNPSPQSQVGLGKENKLFGPTSKDIFERSFAFNESIPLNQEEENNFLEESSDGILNETTPTPESEVDTTMSFNSSFIESSFGTRDSDQKMCDESFDDPFSPPIDE